MVRVLTPQVFHHLTLDRWHDHSESQFPHLQNGGFMRTKNNDTWQRKATQEMQADLILNCSGVTLFIF